MRGEERVATLESKVDEGSDRSLNPAHEADLPPPFTSKGELLEELSNLRRRRGEMLLKDTELHPDVRQLDTEMEILRRQIEMAHN
jgi:hypothetical protein